MKHGLVRLDNVWGVGGGVRPVKYLIKKIVLLLKEYLSSSDINEATLCLKELEVPHFHHELVYEALVMVIESMNEKTEEAMCKLLQSLFRSFIITIDQMKNVRLIQIQLLGFYTLVLNFAGLREDVRHDARDLHRRPRGLRHPGEVRRALSRRRSHHG